MIPVILAILKATGKSDDAETLRWAAKLKMQDVCLELLPGMSKEAIELPDVDGVTALDWAVEGGMTATALAILKATGKLEGAETPETIERLKIVINQSSKNAPEDPWKTVVDADLVTGKVLEQLDPDKKDKVLKLLHERWAPGGAGAKDLSKKYPRDALGTSSD